MWNSARPYNLNQIANEIKYSCRHTGKLFEDNEFSHKDKSILNLAVNYSNNTHELKEKIRKRNEVENQIVWMRARDWCEKNKLRPYFIKNGIVLIMMLLMFYQIALNIELGPFFLLCFLLTWHCSVKRTS